MANHELVLGQNPELALGQSHDLAIGQRHSLGLGQRHGLDLGHLHEHDLGLGHHLDSRIVFGNHYHHSHGHEQDEDHDHSGELALGHNHEADADPLIPHNHDLGLGHHQDSRLVLGNHYHHGHGHEQDEDHDHIGELALGQNHEADVNPLIPHNHDIGLGHHQDSRLVLGNHYHHGHGHEQDEDHDHSGELALGQNHEADVDPLIPHNHDIGLGHHQDSRLVLGNHYHHSHGHEQDEDQNHSGELALGQNHETDADPLIPHNHDLGLGHHQDSRLVLGNHYHHSHGHEQDEGHDHSGELALGHNLEVDADPLLPHNHELILSDNHELALVETHDLSVDPNLEQLDVDHSHELVLHPAHDMSPSHLMLTPILQCRRIVNPDQAVHVGQEFDDVRSCRRALRDAAIACHFEIQTVKSDKTRFTAKCAADGCPWRIHAAKLPGVPTFTIRTINDNHNCSGISHLGHQQASVQWVANSVEERLRENPHCKPKEILEEIHRVHGITLSYKQAWRGKERIMAAVRGSFEEGYRLLPQYCEQVKIKNPGSIAAVCGNPEDNCFKRLFISYYASIYGFVHACRPLIGLDRTILKSKYLGTLLLATGFDGDGALFPLAFGVVDEESDENWIWFLAELHALLENNTENMPRLTILSDRQKGIVDGVDFSFPTAFHGFCMHHLSESFRKEFPHHANLVNLFWEAAHALTIIEFEAKILEIEEISQETAYWIRRIPPRLWATAYFEGTRYGHLTANIAESLNCWLLDASGLPIIHMMECIRRQLMTWFNERREMSMQWSTILVPSAERHVSEAVERAHGYPVVRANEAEFEVISPHEGNNIVDIRNRCCMCCGWQLYGLPCAHGVAALLFCRQNVHRYTESCFTAATYRKAYSQTIHPIPDKTLWKEHSQGYQDKLYVTINPPKSLRPPGRPRKKRIRAEDRGRLKRVVHCGRCNQTGHFRTTCAAPI